MKRSLPIALALVVSACDETDLARLRDKSQGTLSVAPAMRMSDVVKRSTLKLRKLPALGSGVNYATSNAYFDFELAGSALRFHGCSMVSIAAVGSEETVESISVFVTPRHLRWGAFTRELKHTAAKLKADGWEPHVSQGRPTLEAFMEQDGSKIETTPSDVVATFAWSKGSLLLDLSAHRAWDGPRFWSSFDLSDEPWLKPAEMWLTEFPAYPGARKVCSQKSWSMYATKDHETEVDSFYISYGHWYGLKTDVVDRSTVLLTGANGARRLSVHAVGAAYPDCGVRPEAEAKTVVIVSEGMP